MDCFSNVVNAGNWEIKGCLIFARSHNSAPATGCLIEFYASFVVNCHCNKQWHGRLLSPARQTILPRNVFFFINRLWFEHMERVDVYCRVSMWWLCKHYKHLLFRLFFAYYIRNSNGFVLVCVYGSNNMQSPRHDTPVVGNLQ